MMVMRQERCSVLHRQPRRWRSPDSCVVWVSRGVRRGRQVFTTRADDSARRPPDRVKRNFTADRPNAFWVTDLTYVPTWSGMVYVCFIIDVFSRTIVGWRVATHMTQRRTSRPDCWSGPARRRKHDLEHRTPCDRSLADLAQGLHRDLGVLALSSLL